MTYPLTFVCDDGTDICALLLKKLTTFATINTMVKTLQVDDLNTHAYFQTKKSMSKSQEPGGICIVSLHLPSGLIVSVHSCIHT